jgi:hypothetical protein
MEHHKKEEALGHEIWPAQERVPRNNTVSQDIIAFRTGMDAYSTEKDDLTDGLTSNFAPTIAV